MDYAVHCSGKDAVLKLTDSCGERSENRWGRKFFPAAAGADFSVDVNKKPLRADMKVVKVWKARDFPACFSLFLQSFHPLCAGQQGDLQAPNSTRFR